MNPQRVLTTLPLRHIGQIMLLPSLVALIVLGGLWISGSASQKDSFSIGEATTSADNGKRIVARPGFKLKVKNQSTGEVVAFKAEKSTKLSSDSVTCVCRTFVPCGNGASPCCSHSAQARERERCDVSVPEGGGSADCKGVCDQCKWQ